MDREEEGEEDERREAAIASAPSLQPNFKPSKVTQFQLSKFQELHKRRLQIKSRSKIPKKSKGEIRKSNGKDLKTKDCAHKETSLRIEGSSVSSTEAHDNKDFSSLQQDNVAEHYASNKRQKLHWGLDTKERWERKANM